MAAPAYFSLLMELYYEKGEGSRIEEISGQARALKTGKMISQANERAFAGFFRSARFYEDMRDGNYEEAREVLERDIKRSVLPLALCKLNYELAVVDMAENKIGEAKKHLEYTVKHGNNTAFAKKANKKLQELSRK